MSKNLLLSTAVFVLLCSSLLLAACTRSAETDVAPTAEGIGGGGEGVDQAATDAFVMNMNATLIAGNTQTAVAILGGSGGGDGQGVVASSTPTPPPIVELPTATPIPAPATAAPANPSQYTVKPGDWLYKIARDFGVSPQDLIAANPQINPNAILQPGTVLNIPGAAPAGTGGGDTGGKTYTVKLGDNLFRIALNNGTTYQKLAELNGIAPPYTVFVGQVLKLP
jgi:LysM repeat protein